MSTILVTDPAGYLGHSVVRQLLSQPHDHAIMALAGNLSPNTSAKFVSAGVTLRQGNYYDYASLVAAFQGIDKLYFVSGDDIYSRSGDLYDCDAQHENMVRAAQEAGVKHVFYTSCQRKTDECISSLYLRVKGHMHAEGLLRESGLSYTILRHALYTELLPSFIGEDVLQTGTIFLPAEDGRVSFVTGQDMALAGAKLLLQTEPVAESYEISGPQSYSLADVAAILSELSGQPIQYVSPTEDEFWQHYLGSNAEATHSAWGLCQAIVQGELDCPDPTLAQLLGHEPESVKSHLKQKFNL